MRHHHRRHRLPLAFVIALLVTCVIACASVIDLREVDYEPGSSSSSGSSGNSSGGSDARPTPDDSSSPIEKDGDPNIVPDAPSDGPVACVGSSTPSISSGGVMCSSGTCTCNTGTTSTCGLTCKPNNTCVVVCESGRTCNVTCSACGANEVRCQANATCMVSGCPCVGPGNCQ